MLWHIEYGNLSQCKKKSPKEYTPSEQQFYERKTKILINGNWVMIHRHLLSDKRIL